MPELRISLDDLQALAERILLTHDTGTEIARTVARAITLAEADGQAGHGASRLPSYAAQAKSGKVDGHAEPMTTAVAAAAIRVDARGGFAYPALAQAITEVTELAPSTGTGRSGDRELTSLRRRRPSRGSPGAIRTDRIVL